MSATSASGRPIRRSRTTARALGNPLFPTYLWNGLKLAVAGALGAMLFATPAAYALSRFRFRNRNLVMIGLLGFQMISPLVIMVPLYRYMDRIGLTDSHFGAGAHLHRDRGAALHLDAEGLPRRHPAEPRGRGDDRRLHPLRRLHAGGPAAEPAGPHLGLRAERHPRLVAVHHPVHPAQQAGLLPIAVGIFNFQGTYNQTSTQILAAASVLSIVPAVVVFLVLQRFIIGALMAGAVKG